MPPYEYLRQRAVPDWEAVTQFIDLRHGDTPLTKAQEDGLLTTLREALAGVSDPARWCTRTLAMSEEDGPIDVVHSRAQRWCAVGHLQHSYLIRFRYGAPLSVSSPEQVLPLMYGQSLLDAVAYQLWGAPYIIHVNDYIGREAVMECFRFAIQYAEGDVG